MKPSLKDNYLPWRLKVDDFDLQKNDKERLRFLINFGLLAPSSHNSQPWSFTIDGDVIKVSAEPKRMLPIGDSDCRQLYISLGCAVENIAIAAEHFGYKTDISIDTADGSIALKCVHSGVSSGNGDLISAISRRTVNRGKYHDRQIGHEILSKIKGFEDQSVTVDIINDAGRKNRLADCALAATSESMSDRSFRQELSKYVLSNTSASKIGMPGFGLGFPTLLSYFAPFLLKAFNMSRLSNIKDEAIFKRFTPYIVVISTSEDDMKSWIRAGRITERIFLEIALRGISAAIWAAPIQIGTSYMDVQQILDRTFRPQMFFRMGYPIKETGHSPRLSTEEVVNDNKT